MAEDLCPEIGNPSAGGGVPGGAATPLEGGGGQTDLAADLGDQSFQRDPALGERRGGLDRPLVPLDEGASPEHAHIPQGGLVGAAEGPEARPAPVTPQESPALEVRAAPLRAGPSPRTLP